MATPKVKVICGNCGSEKVLRDAWAEWDVEAQDWVLQNIFDHAVCESDVCNGGETEIVEISLENAEKIRFLDEHPSRCEAQRAPPSPETGEGR